jgi:hypothetical protein
MKKKSLVKVELFAFRNSSFLLDQAKVLKVMNSENAISLNKSENAKFLSNLFPTDNEHLLNSHN